MTELVNSPKVLGPAMFAYEGDEWVGFQRGSGDDALYVLLRIEGDELREQVIRPAPAPYVMGVPMGEDPREKPEMLTTLVPARRATRADLPAPLAITQVVAEAVSSGSPIMPSAAVLDAVVEHLNANGGLPVPMGRAANNMLRETLANTERDRDRWRRAHSIVEGERDQARESLRRLRDETNFDLFTVRDQLKQCRGEREQMTRDRDEWKARAEAAEARLADPYSQANQDSAAWDRVAAHPALKMDLLPEADHTYAGRVFERITWLAEAAEARTAPAVTKSEIEQAVHGWVITDELVDAVWSLVSGDDPAVYVVRESAIAAVEVKP